MKKVAIFNHVNTLGGSWTSLVDIINTLLYLREYQVTLITIKPSNELQNNVNDLTTRKLLVHTLNSSVLSFYYFNGGAPSIFLPTFFRNIFNIFIASREIRNYLKTNDFDLIIVNSMTMFYIGKIAKRTKSKTICFMRETIPSYKLSIRKYILLHNMKKYFDLIAFISSYDQKDFVNYKGIKYTVYDKVSDVFMGSPFESAEDSSANFRIATKKDKYYLLFLGGVSELKGTINALRILKELPNEWQMLFVGNDFTMISTGNKATYRNKYLDLCIKYIKKNELLSRIIFLPRTYYVRKYYDASDLVIFPVKLPHQSRPIYEASFSKRYILLPNYPNYNEFSYTNVIFFDRNNISSAINQIISVPNKEKLTSIDPRAISRHSFSILKNEVQEILNKVLIEKDNDER